MGRKKESADKDKGRKKDRPSEVERLRTDSNEAVEYFDPNASSRERRKLKQYYERLRASGAAVNEITAGNQSYDSHGDSSGSESDSDEEALVSGGDGAPAAKRATRRASRPSTSGVRQRVRQGQARLAERLLAHRVESNTNFYLVRWFEADSDEDTWEPASGISKSLLDRYKELTTRLEKKKQ